MQKRYERVPIDKKFEDFKVNFIKNNSQKPNLSYNLVIQKKDELFFIYITT